MDTRGRKLTRATKSSDREHRKQTETPVHSRHTSLDRDHETPERTFEKFSPNTKLAGGDSPSRQPPSPSRQQQSEMPEPSLIQLMMEQFGQITQQLNQNKEEIDQKLNKNKEEINQQMNKNKEEIKQQFREVKEELTKQLTEEIGKVKTDIEEMKESWGLFKININERMRTEQECTKILVEEKMEEYHSIQEIKNQQREEEIKTELREEIKTLEVNTQKDIQHIESKLDEVKEEIKLNQDKIQTPVEIHVNCSGGSTSVNQNLPKFNGRNRNPQEFVEKLRNHYEKISNQNNPQKLHEIIDNCMEDHAARWWQIVKGDISTIDELETKLISKYWSSDVQKGIRRRMELEKYRPGGKLSRSEYFIERVLVMKNLTPKFEERDIVITLSEQFDTRIQDARRVQNVETIEGFERLLDREDIEERNQRAKERPGLKRREDGEERNGREINQKLPRFDNRPQQQNFTPPRFPYHEKQQYNYKPPPHNQNFKTQYPTPNYSHNQNYHRPQFNQNRDPRYRNNPPWNPNQNRQNNRYPSNEQEKLCQQINVNNVNRSPNPHRNQSSPKQSEN